MSGCSISKGDEVRVVYAAARHPWKQELVGRRGRVVDTTGKVVAVEFDIEAWEFPVWFASDALEVVSEEEKQRQEELTEEHRRGMEWAND